MHQQKCVHLMNDIFLSLLMNYIFFFPVPPLFVCVCVIGKLIYHLVPTIIITSVISHSHDNNNNKNKNNSTNKNEWVLKDDWMDG